MRTEETRLGGRTEAGNGKTDRDRSGYSVADVPVCVRCGRVLNRKTTVFTVLGRMCKKHADRLPRHLHKTRGGGR